jgi:uncharacterized protein (TIGR03382 family)
VTVSTGTDWNGDLLCDSGDDTGTSSTVDTGDPTQTEDSDTPPVDSGSTVPTTDSGQTDGKDRCGCATTGTSGAVALWTGLLVLLRRRRV